jgi:rod shape-determining protein MreB
MVLTAKEAVSLAKRGRKKKNDLERYIKTNPGRTKKGENGILYIGIDFGTARTSISTSSGIKRTIKTVVGWPRDIVAKKYVKKKILFGDEALKNRLALNTYRPIEKGVIKNTNKDMEAAKQLIKYAIELGKNGHKYKKVYGVIGAPALTDHIHKQALKETACEVLDAAMVVSEPFSVAYGLNRLNNSIIVDIGAGTVDLCRMHGTLPEDEDEASITKAGDYIDELLLSVIKKRYKGAQITENMVQEWKEKHGFVSDKKKEPVTVEFPLDGQDGKFDIATELQKSCESIVPDISENLRRLISTYDPEFQHEIRNNVVLAGGCCQIDGLPEYLEEKMKRYGGVKVTVVSDPVYAGADGALKLAREMPEEYWEELKAN